MITVSKCEAKFRNRECSGRNRKGVSCTAAPRSLVLVIWRHLYIVRGSSCLNWNAALVGRCRDTRCDNASFRVFMTILKFTACCGRTFLLNLNSVRHAFCLAWRGVATMISCVWIRAVPCLHAVVVCVGLNLLLPGTLAAIRWDDAQVVKLKYTFYVQNQTIDETIHSTSVPHLFCNRQRFSFDSRWKQATNLVMAYFCLVFCSLNSSRNAL